jgi:hypothetical protein
MTHLHLTQWIEEADGREVCQDASWKLGPAKTANIAARLMNVAGLFFWAALIAAPIVSGL